jgi:hypothetical protein
MQTCRSFFKPMRTRIYLIGCWVEGTKGTKRTAAWDDLRVCEGGG